MPPQSEPQSPNDNASNKSPPKRGRRRLLIIIGVIVLCPIVIAAAIWYWRSTFYESTDDAYIEGHPVLVSARVAGNVVKLYVNDNQWVDQGAPLTEIDPCDYQIRLEQAQATVQAAQAGVNQAAAEVDVAQATLTRDEQDLRRYEALAKTNSVSVQDLEHAGAAADVSRANLAAAQTRLATAHAQVVQARAAADQARLNLSYTQVGAPQAGYVTQKAVEVGTYLATGQAILAIVPERLYVKANFKETQLTHMRPGLPATVSVDIYPGLSLKAHVDSIQAGTGAAFSLFPPENATGNFVKIVQRVPVKIVFDELPDPNHRLVIGASVVPKVRVR